MHMNYSVTMLCAVVTRFMGGRRFFWCNRFWSFVNFFVSPGSSLLKSGLLCRLSHDRWRKSGWPLVLSVQPGSDSSASYARIEDCFWAEVRRRGLPPPHQLNSDWFSSLGTGFKLHARGIEHCVRNLDKNNRQGRARAAGALLSRRSRSRRPKAAASRRRAHQPVDNDQQAPPLSVEPHLKSRDLSIFLAYLYESLFLPTRHFFVSRCESNALFSSN